MKPLARIVTAIVLSGTAVIASAQDYQHFKPKPAENLQQAIMNLTEYNAKLEELSKGELSAQEMAKVHELTYTLEVALARLSKELDVAANSLEQVHLGSEQMNKARVKGFAQDYLNTVNEVLGEHKKHH